MQIQIVGKHIDLGDALRERIAGDLEAVVSKYFDRPSEANVAVAKEGHNFTMDCHIHLPSGINLQAGGSGGDAYIALEDMLARLDKRVRRYKRRLRDHHKRAPLPIEAVASYVLQSQDDEMEAEDTNSGLKDDDQPVIVAEMQTDIKTMTVSMAVMQLELAEAPALMFRNAAHGEFSMVYRRNDGHIGWVDPSRQANEK